MKVKEVIELINSEAELYSLGKAEDLLSEHNVEQVAYGLDIDKHWLYTIETEVYKCDDGFVGVTGLGTLYSEMMLPSDCDVHCFAEEYTEVVTTTYKRKE